LKIPRIGFDMGFADKVLQSKDGGRKMQIFFGASAEGGRGDFIGH